MCLDFVGLKEPDGAAGLAQACYPAVFDQRDCGGLVPAQRVFDVPDVLAEEATFSRVGGADLGSHLCPVGSGGAQSD